MCGRLLHGGMAPYGRALTDMSQSAPPSAFFNAKPRVPQCKLRCGGISLVCSDAMSGPLVHALCCG